MKTTECEDYTFWMIRYAITAGESDNARSLTERARRWSDLGLDYVQLREKALPAGELARVAEALVAALQEHGGQTKLLVNGRVDIAVAAGAAGVHLTAAAGELTARQVRQVFALAGSGAPVISSSCHALEEIQRATEGGSDLILFGPVFEKRVSGELVVGGLGVGRLREACTAAGSVPVLALGGVTEDNLLECMGAGAEGVAGIRIFG